MNSYTEWAVAYPEAALALGTILTTDVSHTGGGSEARAQQRARLDISRQGALSWRNNVGATPAKCPDCQAPQQPVRYGLANDSVRVNQRIKSSDLILLIPRMITPDMVGKVIGQFGAVEVKRPGSVRTTAGREAAQSAWLALVAKNGGYASFSTGGVAL